MGVKFPENDEELTLEVESFIDEHGKIDMQAMKEKGYNDSQICDIMNEYFLATAKRLAEYRKERKAKETVMFFLEEANRLHDEKVEVIDKYMAFACNVKAAEKIDRDTFVKYEKCLQYVSDVKSMCDKYGQKCSSSSPAKLGKGRDQSIRDCSSAENLSPSKYFRVPSPENNVRGVKSCHDLHNPITQRKRGKEKVEVVSRVPTPYPHFVSHVNQSPSYTTKLVNVEAIPKVKQMSAERKDLSFVTNYTSPKKLKTAINHYEECLGLRNSNEDASDEVASDSSNTSIKSADSAASAAVSIKSANSTVCAASSSHSSNSFQDYVKINIEKTPADTPLSCYTLESLENSEMTTSITSCIYPPPPSAEFEIDQSESTVSSETSSLVSTEIITEYRQTSSMSVLATSGRSSQPDFDFGEELMRKCFSSESHKFRHFSIECSEINKSLSLTLSQTTCNQSDVPLLSETNSTSYCGSEINNTNRKYSVSRKSTRSPSSGPSPPNSISNNNVESNL